jgi:hypothetical protein
MLVDPTGKVQAELDANEGIAFGEIGPSSSQILICNRLTAYYTQTSILSTRPGVVYQFLYSVALIVTHRWRKHKADEMSIACNLD